MVKSVPILCDEFYIVVFLFNYGQGKMMVQTGDRVKFVLISATDYDNLEEIDDSTVYFIQSNLEQRVAVGQHLFANYVPAHCTAIELSPSSGYIGLGESFTLTAITQPADPSDAIVFTASNNNVIIDPTGMSNKVLVTGSAQGNTTITCTCGEVSATCDVEIHPSYEYVEHILAENYNPNGQKFKFTAPIAIENGQWIEISIDLTTVTGTKENIISIGQTIDVWQGANTGPRIHMYDTAPSIRTISTDLILDTKTRRPTYSATVDSLLLRLDRRGLTINGSLYLFDKALRATPTLDYQTGMDALLALTSFDIGSQEGSNRSHATYNYIKYYTAEVVTP